MMIANAAGVISAAPKPCAARAPTSTPAVEANPLTRDAVVNTARPVIRTRRRDSRSAIRPPSSNPPPDISRYAVTTHCRSPLLNCRSAPMVGNAVLTTEMSNTTRTCATNASASTAHDRRSGSPSVPRLSGWSLSRNDQSQRVQRQGPAKAQSSTAPAANGEIPAVSPAREHPIAPNTDDTPHHEAQATRSSHNSHPTSSTAADARSPGGEDKVPQPTMTTTADAPMSMTKQGPCAFPQERSVRSGILLPVPSAVLSRLE